MRRANSEKKVVIKGDGPRGAEALTFGGCGVPHLGVLEDLVQFGTVVLIGASPAVGMIAVSALGAETEEHALLGGFRAFAENACVRAGKAALAFLQKGWSARGLRKGEQGGNTKIKPLTKELEGRSSKEMAGCG